MEIKRNQYLDVMKAIASIFVVLIHCVYPGEVGTVFKALARFAVPLFFMISGYFFYDHNKDRMNASIHHKISRLLYIIVISGMGYFMLEIAESIFLAGGLRGAKEYLMVTITWENILRLFITNTPLLYTPRWFLYALIYCYLLLFLYNKIDGNYKCLYIGGWVLLMCHLIIELFYGYGFEVKYQIGNSETVINIRNIFLLRAFPWFVYY